PAAVARGRPVSGRALPARRRPAPPPRARRGGRPPGRPRGPRGRAGARRARRRPSPHGLAGAGSARLGLMAVARRCPSVVAQDLSVWFGEVQVLRELDLTCRAGELTAVIGPPGGGKSTLL